MRRLVRLLAVLVVAHPFTTSAALGQAGAGLHGTVRDAAGVAVSSVLVTATPATDVGVSTTRTDEAGRYHFERLPAGRYLVNAAIGGIVTDGLAVEIAAEAVTLDLVLEAASALEHVTVVAMRRGAEDIQMSSAAISSLSANSLDRLGARNITGLADVVPTLAVSPATYNASVTIRGIGTNSTSAGADPSSTVHLDGIYLSRPSMAALEFLDVDRIEVMRGPQGTLYGRNSVGGTVNVTTRLPTNTFESRAQITAGDFGGLRLQGAVGGPLIRNRVMASVALGRSVRDGFVRDLNHAGVTLGGDDTWTGRAHVRVLAGSRAEIRASYDATNFDATPLFYIRPVSAKPGFPAFDNPSNFWDVRASHVAEGFSRQRGASARAILQIDERTTFTSLTGVRWSDFRAFFDPDGTELSILTADIRDDQRQFSEEITLVRKSDAQSWIGGLYVFDETDDGPLDIAQFNVPPGGIERRPFSSIGTRSWAAFGEYHRRLLPRLSATLGMRYSRERKSAHNSGGVYRLGTTVLTDPATAYDFTDEAEFSALTPKVAVEMPAGAGSFLYASATRGFKSGGFNVTATVPGTAFKPEFAWSFEGGMKYVTPDGRFRVNTAGFYTDYQDLQVQTFVAAGVIDISNAASSTIKGVEIESAAVWGGVQVAGTLAWLDAVYAQYLAVAPGTAAVDAAGHRLNNAPAWSGSVSADYTFAAGRRGRVFVHGDVPWQSRVFFTPFNVPEESQGAYGRVQLRAGFQPSHGRWELSVFVRNAGNQPYITGTNNAPPFPAYVGRPGEPRHWGTQLTLQY